MVTKSKNQKVNINEEGLIAYRSKDIVKVKVMHTNRQTVNLDKISTPAVFQYTQRCNFMLQIKVCE